jgi:hypothetical protein
MRPEEDRLFVTIVVLAGLGTVVIIATLVLLY